ncbi:MAG: hypothetical protein HUU16_10865 [Candidatus Omnitrophica bacterium]|nr:hypothetical protein [Candidatus Omnitrophota bacterium]
MEHQREQSREHLGHGRDRVGGFRSRFHARLQILKPESALVDNRAVAHNRNAQARELGKVNLSLQPSVDLPDGALVKRTDIFEFRLDRRRRAAADFREPQSAESEGEPEEAPQPSPSESPIRNRFG